MKLFHYHHLQEIVPGVDERCLTIGVFDGLHPGHCFLLEKLLLLSQCHQCVPSLWTFGQDIPKPGFERLMSEPQFLKGLSQFGIEEVHRMDFIEEVKSLSAEDFLKVVLIDGLKVKCLVLGADARLGKSRSTDAPAVKEIAKRMGLEVHIVNMKSGKEGEWSSSQMREWVRMGDFSIYEQALGRPYVLGGIVVQDQGLARKLGFPTANLEIEGMVHPPIGVYAVKVTLPNGTRPQLYRGMAYIGSRPTVQAQERKVLEVHLIDFNEDLYGEYLEVSDFKFLRAEQKFDQIENLKHQLSLDLENAR